MGDAAGCIDTLNPAAELFFGLSERQASGRRLDELGPGLEALQELVERALTSGASFGQNLELPLPQPERPPAMTACRVSPLQGEDADGFILELLDASQWRLMDREKSLISQHGASRRIIHQLAHEVRNPLGGLRGAAQLLERELHEPELREYTQVIIREADRLVALTDNLLGPTRQACREAVNIHELLERVILLLTSEVSTRVELIRDYDPSLPPVQGDADQLMQALLNLGRNAVQAVGDAGQVVFRTRAITGYLIGDQRHRLVMSVEIEDDGPGVPEELLESLFYPLVTSRPEGTGLGLPLAQDLVSRNGGLIEFESSPGRTIFLMRLPVEQ